MPPIPARSRLPAGVRMSSGLMLSHSLRSWWGTGILISARVPPGRSGFSTAVLVPPEQRGSSLPILLCSCLRRNPSIFYHQEIILPLARTFSSSTTRVAPSSATSMELLKELRAVTGAPVVDCKKALESVLNDDKGAITTNTTTATATTSADSIMKHDDHRQWVLQAAMDWLRQHGAAKIASKVQGRATTEGLVGLVLSEDRQHGGLVQLASETDFAGRSDKFVALVMNVGEATCELSSSLSSLSTSLSLSSSQSQHQKPGDDDRDGCFARSVEPETLLATVHAGTGKTLNDLLKEAIVAIRENISIAQAIPLHTSRLGDGSSRGDGVLVGYVHNRVKANVDAGMAAAVVEVIGLDPTVADATLQNVGKKLAMHIVAARPDYLSMQDVPEAVLEHERQILLAQIQQQEAEGVTANNNKPRGQPKSVDVVEKIVQGRLRKFYEGVCLLEQPHMIEENSPKVRQVLQDQGVQVKRFKRLSIT